MYRGVLKTPRSKLLLIMKLTFFFLMVGLLEVHAGLHAQVKMVDLDVKEMTLRDVFQELKRQTDLDFFFSNRELDMNSRVTISARKAELTDVLSRILGKRYSFEIISGMVIIKPADARDSVVVKEMIVKGFVRDQKKEPMPGVTVKLDGVGVGTATNVKGFFRLALPISKGILEFSFIGYKTQRIPFSAETKDTLRIVMEEEVSNLDEVSVVAYGTTTRRQTTGAVSSVKAKELEGIPSPSIANLLQGRVAGMDVTNMSGAPGGGGTAIVIRGYNSMDVEQSRRFSNPLWVVDGVPLNSFTSPVTGTNLLADINPDMIESVEILKDASSASIYGSRAANGVILVTTKKGRKNQDATFSVNLSQTWGILPRLPDITIGNVERRLRLQGYRQDQQAYLDIESMKYKYPTSWKENYMNPSSVYDPLFKPDPGRMAGNGLFLQDSLNSFYNNATNFFPMYYETGKTTNANIQAYGGSERMNYGIGLGYYDESGILIGTGFNRIDLNSNMLVNPVKRFTVDMRFNASLANRKRGTSAYNSEFTSAVPVETVPGDPLTMSSLFPGKGSVVWDDVLEKLRGTKEKNRSIRLRSNFKLGYDVVEGLNVSTSLSVDYSINRRNYFVPSYLNESGYSMSVGETGINLMVLNENLVSYKKVIKEDHRISAVAGFSYQYDQGEYNGGSGKNSPSDKIYYVRRGFPDIGWQEGGGGLGGEIIIGDGGSGGSIGGSGTKKPIAFQHYLSNMEEKVLISYFARVEYGFRDKYLLSLSFRRDGSSTFGEDNRWGTFPSVAAGWNFSEENFMRPFSGWLDFAKIRASWGRSGLCFETPYLALGIITTGQKPFEGNGVLQPDWGVGAYNEELSWEETDQFDVGLDLDLFNHRLSFTFDYYYRYTDKLLGSINAPGDYNGWGSQMRNVAAVSNAGVEFMVKYEILRSDDLYWKVSVNGARNWNRYEKSYDGKDDRWYNRVLGKSLNGLKAYKTEGYLDSQDELPIYYNSAGMGSYLSHNGQAARFYQPGALKIVDVNGDGRVDHNDRVYAGSALPTLYGGIVNEFKWKGFDLNMLFSYQLGRHMYNTMPGTAISPMGGGSLFHPLLISEKDLSFWEKPGDHDAKYPRLQMERYSLYPTDGGAMIDRYVEKVNWMKLKTVTVGYRLPQSWVNKMGVNELRFFVSGENLFTITNYSGLDPETVDISNGIDDGMNYPLARKYTIGLTLKF